MLARFYTLLFVFLPPKLSSKLWNWIANRHGYVELTRFGNTTMHCMGTRHRMDDLYAALKPKGENGQR